MTAQQYQALLQRARIYAAQLRVQLGIPPPGLVPAAAPAPPAAAQQAADPLVWVSLENDHGRVIGEIIADDGVALPAGSQFLGATKALVPMGNGALAVKQVLKSEVGSMSVKDLRVLPLVFDQQGNRRQEFALAVARMTQDSMPEGGLLLDGPASGLGVLRSMVARGLTPVTDREHWVTARSMRWRSSPDVWRLLS